MTDLISIKNENGKQTVSARELHEKLEVTERFSAWFERMLKFGFEENNDFVGCKEFNTLAKQELQNYHISLDMAKEICMIQRSEIGRKFRQYFIECEKKLHDVQPAIQYVQQKSDRELNVEEAHILENLMDYCPIETYKQILAAHISKKVSGEFLLPLPKAEKKTYSATQIAEMCGVSKQKVGSVANKHSLKTKEYGEIIWDRAKNGKMVENFVYYENGVDKIKSLLS